MFIPEWSRPPAQLEQGRRSPSTGQKVVWTGPDGGLHRWVRRLVERLGSAAGDHPLPRCSPALVREVQLLEEAVRPCSGGQLGLGADLDREQRAHFARVSLDAAGHAAWTAATAAQLGADDRHQLDSVLGQKGAGPGVPLIPQHHSRGDGQEVVRVVPLLALGRPVVEWCAHDPQAVQIQQAGERREERPVLLHLVLPVPGRSVSANDRRSLDR